MSVAKETERRGAARLVFAAIGLLGGLTCLVFAAIGISRSLEDHSLDVPIAPGTLSEAVGGMPTVSDVLRKMLSGENHAQSDPSADAMRDELAAAGLILRDHATEKPAVIDAMLLLPEAPEGWLREEITDPERLYLLHHEIRYRQRATLIRSDGDVPPPMPWPRPFKAAPPKVGVLHHTVMYVGPEDQMILITLSQQTQRHDGIMDASLVTREPSAYSARFSGRWFGYDRSHEWDVFTSISLNFGTANRLSINADVAVSSLGWLERGLDLSILP